MQEEQMLTILEQLQRANTSAPVRVREKTPRQKLLEIGAAYFRNAPREKLGNGLGSCVDRKSAKALAMYFQAVKDAEALGFSKDQFHEILGLLIDRARRKEKKNAAWRAKNRDYMREYAKHYRMQQKNVASNVEVRGEARQG